MSSLWLCLALCSIYVMSETDTAARKSPPKHIHYRGRDTASLHGVNVTTRHGRHRNRTRHHNRVDQHRARATTDALQNVAPPTAATMTQLRDRHDVTQHRDIASKHEPSDSIAVSAANHEPLYGSEPPISDSMELQQNPAFKTDVSVKDSTHDNRLYSDQPAQMEYLQNDNYYSRESLTEARDVNIMSSIKTRSAQSRHDSLQQYTVDSTGSKEKTFDLEMTTEGQTRQVLNRDDITRQGAMDDPEFLKDLVLDLQEELMESKSSQRLTR